MGKTSAAETVGLPLAPQVTKQEQRRLKGIEKERKRKQVIEDNRARAKATRSVIDNPSLCHSAATEIGDDEVDILEPHCSHDIKQMQSHAITFCNNCGKWAFFNQHSQLALPCLEIKRGYKHTLRLLQNDVVPGEGAKLPASAKLKPGRKRR